MTETLLSNEINAKKLMAGKKPTKEQDGWITS